MANIDIARKSGSNWMIWLVVAIVAAIVLVWFLTRDSGAPTVGWNDLSHGMQVQDGTGTPSSASAHISSRALFA